MHLIKQLLDIGAQNLLTPMVDTAEQARQLVLATQYPPLGLRGVGRMVARSSRWAARTYSLDVADAEICLLVQAESVLALENLEEICAVDGVDGVFIGPADLAASMGYLGQPFHPKVQATIEGAITTIVKSGKAAGTLMSDPKVARRYLALGATFVATGVDVWSSPTLRANWRQTLWRPTWEHTGPRLHPLARATQQASIFRACEFA